MKFRARLASLAAATKNLGRRKGFRRAGFGLLFFLVVVLVLASEFVGGFSLREGQICPTDIRATRSLTYVDERETERLRAEAAARVEKIYREDAQVASQLGAKVARLYGEVKAIRNSEAAFTEKVTLFRQLLARETGAAAEEISSLPLWSISALLQASDAELERLALLSKKFLEEELRYGLKEEALPSARESLKSRVAVAGLDKSLQPVVSFILVHTIRPNLIFDREAYEKRVEMARAAVPPVQRTIMGA